MSNYNVTYCEDDGGDAEDMPRWLMRGNTVRAYHYPHCCTGLILANLGGSSNEFGGNCSSYKKLKQDITDWIKWSLSKGNWKQFISVSTTDEQERANEVLKELGFTKSRWITNRKYTGTRLATWIYDLNSYREQN